MARSKRNKNLDDRRPASSMSRTSSGSSKSSKQTSSSAPRTSVSHESATKYDGPQSPSAKSPKATPKSPTESPAQASGSAGSSSLSRIQIKPKDFDLGATQWAVVHGYDSPSDLPLRPRAATKLGQETKIGLNTFNVTAFPTKTVYQYQIMIGSGAEKRGVITKVWASKKIQDRFGGKILFDGENLAWGLKPIDKEIREIVDLDQENGKTPRPGKEDKHRVIIRQTTEVKFDSLMECLKGRLPFDNDCLVAVNFLDHLLREHPSRSLIKIKRAFYPRNGEAMDLGGGLEVVKGVYSSLRMVLGPQGPCLSVNVDVSNGTFFKALPLVQLVCLVTNTTSIDNLVQSLKREGGHGRLARDMKRLQKTRVIAKHRGLKRIDEYVIDKFEFKSAKQVTFEHKDSKTGQISQVSVFDYFRKAYNIQLKYPELPLVRTPKRNYLPMEILDFKPHQACRYKLDERQTSNMIKFAVTPPVQRWSAVQQGLNTLNWAADPVLAAYGMKINNTRTVVPARILQAPKVQFANGSANPGTSGRWDLKGKKFFQPNAIVLKSWAVTVVCGRRGGKPDKTIVQGFINSFVNSYIQHGGRVENRQPPMVLATGDDPAHWVTSAWNTAGSQANSRPQMLVFILPDKDSTTYGRIKRSCDCRYGVVSQCMQYVHVQKNQAQYISNVCMKFNAKLGGITARAMGAKSSGDTGLLTTPTVVIGADVSHAAPGSTAASTAAITVSMDRLATRYAAAVDTNGHRVEMISEANIKKHLQPMLQHWCQTVNNGKLPSRVIYLRDGVSEGQYVHVIQQEVHNMKAIFKTVAPNSKIDFVVIIGQKRHHIRFFPDKGDRNGNAFPGTLVEHGATHPHENDFFLCSHAAIKGTARPTHYQIILNEANLSNEEVYTMLYEHVYQYIRATTPVSIHPAIYYAHIASNRAVSHDPRFGSNPEASLKDSSDTSAPAVVDPLLDMPDTGGIRTSMWYI